VNICRIPGSDNTSVSLPQHLIGALGRLQSRPPGAIAGSVYIYDLVDQCTLSASCSVAAMLGYTTEAIHDMGLIGLASLIHPDDLTLVSEHYQRFTTLRFGEVITIAYRMKRANDTWCHLRSRETPLVIASDGFPLQILGIIQTIPHLSLAKTRNFTLVNRSSNRRKPAHVNAALIVQ